METKKFKLIIDPLTHNFENRKIERKKKKGLLEEKIVYCRHKIDGGGEEREKRLQPAGCGGQGGRGHGMG